MKALVVSLVFLFGLSGCSTESTDNKPQIQILYSASAPKAIKLTAQDLAEDLALVLNANIKVNPITAASDQADYYYLVAPHNDIQQSVLLSDADKQRLQKLLPGPRGGVIHQFSWHNTPLILMTGPDVQGTQYSVYDYSKLVLGIDPLRYWTGAETASIAPTQLTAFRNQVIAPPIVPLLVYFENDVDELANLKAPLLQYDWTSFTEMVDALVRLRYNGIEFFDMLGRVEFYTRPEYKQVLADYQLDVAYLDKMIDYVHDKGMYVQIDMMMGRQLKTLSTEAANCWTEHRQEWLDTWRSYLTDTPVKKADIFALRPRHQIWDWEYESECGEDKATVFNEVYAELGKLIDEYKADATKVCTCYHDGMEIFNEDFNPPKDFIISWSDNGWGEFDYLPKDTKGYKFGTYMHAGFWLNHDVFDPYPEVIDNTMTKMYQHYDATHYLMVNGQTFRPFMLNLEAFSESARLGTAFDGEQFYLDWVSRYFGETVASETVQAMKLLHQAHSDKTGYVEILWQVKNLQAYLADIPVRRPGREEFTVLREKIEPWFSDTQPRITQLQQALQITRKALDQVPKNATFYHDHIQLPIEIYLDLLRYNQALIELVDLKHQWQSQKSEDVKTRALAKLQEAQAVLEQTYQRRLQGDKDPRWNTWYDPKKRRPNNGFPHHDDLQLVATAINQNW